MSVWKGNERRGRGRSVSVRGERWADRPKVEGRVMGMRGKGRGDEVWEMGGKGKTHERGRGAVRGRGEEYALERNKDRRQI